MTVCDHRSLKGPARLLVLLTALLIPGVTPTFAQETVIIGGQGGGTSFIGGPRSGVTINNEVLDSLSPAGPAPGLPYMPQATSPSMPGGGSIIAPGPAATAYRMPGTGQLVVSRPSTLLFPPLQSPGSRLTVTPPARAQSPAVAPQMATAEEPRSQLLVPPPPREEQPQTEIVQPPDPAPEIEPVQEETIVEVQPPSTTVEEPQAESEPEPAPEPETMVEQEPEPEPEPQTAAVTPPAPEPEPEPAPVEQAAAPPTPPVPPSLTQELQAATIEPPTAPEPPAKMVEPPPAPAEVLAPEKAPETQTAALPPPTTGLDEVRVLFNEGSAELSDTAKQELDAFSKLLKQDTSSRIQLLAYATASDSASRARRLSLSRALAVRAYLIDKGVRSTRMDVRALGQNVEAGPADRVDILLQAARQ